MRDALCAWKNRAELYATTYDNNSTRLFFSTSPFCSFAVTTAYEFIIEGDITFISIIKRTTYLSFSLSFLSCFVLAQ